MPNIDFDRQPPKIEEANAAEPALLGAVLLEPRQLDVVADIVSGKDFFDIELGRIFNAMLDLHQAGVPVNDFTVLVRELERMELLRGFSFGGFAGRHALARLESECGYAGNAPLYAHQIRDYAGLRRIADASANVYRSTYNVDATRSEIAEKAIAEFESVIVSDLDTAIDLTEVVETEANAIEASSKSGKPLGIPTGMVDLDELTGGFFPSEVTVLAARPSIGKSALALELAARVAGKGHPVLLVSLEMSAQQIAHRMLSRETGIPSRRIQKSDLITSELTKIDSARDALRKLALPIKLYATAGATPARIGARARVQMAQIGLKLIVIDYLGLMQSTERHKTLYERVTAVSREVKLMAQALNVPVLMLAQLNREGAKGLPTLEQLRDSGAIEQDADNVWFLHREDRIAKECKLIIAKQRQGEVGTIELDFDGSYMTFTESLGTVAGNWEPTWQRG